MKKNVIAFVSNNLASDQRLHKVCNTLSKNGYNVKLVGTTLRGCPELNLPFEWDRIPVFFQKNVWFYAELNLKLFFYLLFHSKKNSILLANDLDTLLPIYLIAKIFKIPLVYDSHEIFSELPSLKPGSFQQKTWKTLEKWLVPKVKHFYTVSHSYARWFENAYGIKPQIVRNVPRQKTVLDAPNQKPSPHKKVLIYQGALNTHRGIECMIKAMEHLPHCELWIVGDGPIAQKLQKITHQLKLVEQVIFWGRKSPEELWTLTPQADIGLSLEHASAPSYQFALPNKLFDYVQAQIPVLGSAELPEIVQLIADYQMGEITDPRDPKQIAEKVQMMLANSKPYYKAELEKAATELIWEKEEEVVLRVFEDAEIN